MDIKLAECCGSCLHSNKPVKSRDHAAHYETAKTERWCYLHGLPVTRESVCENGYELDNKKGAAPAFKRALKQIKRLNAILDLKERILKDGPIVGYRKTYHVIDGKVKYEYNDGGLKGSYYTVSCKETYHDDVLGIKK